MQFRPCRRTEVTRNKDVIFAPATRPRGCEPGIHGRRSERGSPTTYADHRAARQRQGYDTTSGSDRQPYCLNAPRLRYRLMPGWLRYIGIPDAHSPPLAVVSRRTEALGGLVQGRCARSTWWKRVSGRTASIGKREASAEARRLRHTLQLVCKRLRRFQDEGKAGRRIAAVGPSGVLAGGNRRWSTR